jgi:hypothetical protein
MRPQFLPIPEIEFAVRVGFLTKEIWREFFATGGLRWQQMVWRQFREKGIFRSRAEWPDLYLPNPKHPLVRERSTYLAKAPILNQLGHDVLVARSYLLLKRALPGLEIKTEALLKREDPLRNKGERVSDTRKHPDLIVISGDKTTAIEIELTQKSRRRYGAILRNYRRLGYSKIIYVIRSKATMNAIENAASDVSFPTEAIPIGYGSIANWRERPASTEITFDHEVRTLMETLGK